jgi:outer membrane protein OmpA-like peptidoglycan-associated protein
MRNLFGCKFIYEDTQTIERYSGFEFESQSAELSEAGALRVNDLINQIQEYGFVNLRFDILGNVDDADLSDEQKQTLSLQRAEAVKAKLVEAGALESNIVLHAKADKAPIATNGVSEGQKLNNRVDIIVRKLKK